MAKTTFYVQFEPEFIGPNNNVRAIRATTLTKGRPAVSRSRRTGSVVVKMTVEIPDQAFKPLEPEAVITIPASLTEVLTPVEIEATAP